ncbi:MAG: zeta toxin family protein [Oscillospiraceae bacterium]
MEKDNVLAVMGSPGSGKTTTAIKLAQALSRQRKNVIVVFCDPFTPTIPAILPVDALHDTSLGSLLTAPTLSQTDILNACVPVRESENISLLGYRTGETLMNYPKITKDKAVEFFVMLRYLADYIIIDCTSIFEADPASIMAIEIADRVLKLGTANLKGISYYQTHNPMLLDSRFCKEKHQTALGNLKVGQDWEAVSGQYGGVDYILPYTVELERQDNELSLFQPMVEPESVAYENAIVKLLSGIFSVQTAKVVKTKDNAPPSAAPTPTAKKSKGLPSFKLPFGRSKGEF